MRERNKAGARRSRTAIQANPMATDEDLAWLQKKDPIATVQHPNCPLDIWWELAADHPVEAMASVLFSLLTLEDPARWEKLQQDHIGDWVVQAAKRLPFRERELFTADCAELVLRIYARAHPNDRRVREAIEARRFFANGQISDEEWADAELQVYDAANGTDDYYAAYAVLSPLYAVYAVAYPAKYGERVWQWKRVQQYTRREIQQRKKKPQGLSAR